MKNLNDRVTKLEAYNRARKHYSTIMFWVWVAVAVFLGGFVLIDMLLGS